MKSFAAVLRLLQAAHYLEVQLGQYKQTNIILLSNGVKYCEQLVHQWRHAGTENVTTHFIEHTDKSQSNNSQSRLAFIRSSQFYAHLEELRTSGQAQCPAVVKAKYKIPATMSTPFDFKADDCLLTLLPSSKGSTLLVSDYFFHAESGLEKFYNIQRERKIWWMRFSANPSRYFLEPYSLATDEYHFHSKQCQSIDIKARFSFGIADVEHITLLPLRAVTLEHDKDFHLIEERSGSKVLPAVIRSVIHVEAAACAMLFDGCDHNRETLLLNRKLVPFQCLIAGLHNDTVLEDLRDMCVHVSHVLQRAGLRFSPEKNVFSKSKEELLFQLQMADKMGIPYALVVDEETLRTGLLKLRNRDTTLEETVHISDIPEYLLHIFIH